MIVTADAAHQCQKRSGLYKDGKAITDNRERRGDAERREKQHRNRHRDTGEKSGEQASKQCFRSAHQLTW